MNRSWTFLPLALAAWLPVTAAGAQDAQALYVRGLAATCANCHGTTGRTVDDSSVPAIAGMRKDEMLGKLKAFREGREKATVMHQIAKGFSDEQLDQVTTWFAAQKK